MSRLGQRWETWWLKPCGTPAAYRRHIRHSEPICEPCRQAEARRGRDYRRRRATRASRPTSAPEWDGQPSYEVRREILTAWDGTP